MLTTVIPIQVFATQSRSEHFSGNYTLTGNGATDMIAIAKAQVGKTQSQLGYTERWCADFVCDCAKLAGQSKAIPAYGACEGLHDKIIAAGGKEVPISEAKPGDLWFGDWKHSKHYAHVELIYNVGTKISSYGGNGGSPSQVKNHTSVSKSSFANGGEIYVVVRPNYGGSSINPAISFSNDKNVVRTEETISFFYDGLRDATYVEICFEKDGKVYFTDDTTKLKEYTTYFINEGVYYVFVRAQIYGDWNSSSKLRVDVTNPVFNTDKTQVLTNEEILFSYDHLTNANKVELCFQKESKVYFRQDVTKSKTTINYFENPGEYETFVQANYNGTIITSNLIHIYVKNDQAICSHTNTTNVDAVASTCITHGHMAYTICKDCDKIIAGSNEELQLAEHTGGIATCNQKAICEVCGIAYGDYAEHNLRKHEKVKATIDNEGNIEYWTCNECGKYFSDAEGKNVISSKDIVIKYIIGDGNGDGKINAEDLIVLRKALLTDSKYSKVLDANGDGIVDIRDLVRLKKLLAS